MSQFKTTLLLGALTALIVALGYYLGGQSGAIYALVISAIMNFGSYWFSHKIVLMMYRAKEIPPAAHGDLHEIVASLANRAHMPKPKLYSVDLPVPNAFATGRNESHAVVAVTPSILKILDREELEGVLSHELSHIKNKDMLVSSIAATIAGAISYLAQMAWWGGAAFGGGRDRNGGSPIGALALLILTPIVATLLHLAISRSREYMADESGARVSRNPRGLASALRKLESYAKAHPLAGEPKYEATAHLFIVNPFKPSFLMHLFSTHPPMAERVRRLEAMRS